eukprot:TRINITY_DN3415_c0_g1_i9.p1 TRINITY_DN3415_c0_g1~~TRINITY_DN3415_c0_g1_i9.p1  ORF type:complete len:156 (-),score=24.15 TRINITY_DN3415_c0_g1_i9:909-1376(-)
MLVFLGGLACLLGGVELYRGARCDHQAQIFRETPITQMDDKKHLQFVTKRVEEEGRVFVKIVGDAVTSKNPPPLYPGYVFFHMWPILTKAWGPFFTGYEKELCFSRHLVRGRSYSVLKGQDTEIVCFLYHRNSPASTHSLGSFTLSRLENQVGNE